MPNSTLSCSMSYCKLLAFTFIYLLFLLLDFVKWGDENHEILSSFAVTTSVPQSFHPFSSIFHQPFGNTVCVQALTILPLHISQPHAFHPLVCPAGCLVATSILWFIDKNANSCFFFLAHVFASSILFLFPFNNKVKKANKIRRVDRPTNALPDQPTDRPTNGHSQL